MIDATCIKYMCLDFFLTILIFVCLLSYLFALKLFQLQNCGNDVSMSRKIQADNKAYICLLEEKLKPAFVSRKEI